MAFDFSTVGTCDDLLISASHSLCNKFRAERNAVKFQRKMRSESKQCAPYALIWKNNPHLRHDNRRDAQLHRFEHGDKGQTNFGFNRFDNLVMQRKIQKIDAGWQMNTIKHLPF